MAGLTDEDLMRLADGQVSAEERKAMLDELAQDPEARARLARFEATGHVLAEPFNPIVNAPVPRGLVDVIMRPNVGETRSEPVRAARQPSDDGMVSHILGRLFSMTAPRWAPAFASGLLLAGGVAGWLLASAGSQQMAGSFRIEGGRIAAQGALAKALETARSGEMIAASGGREMPAGVEVRLTFIDKGKTVCRQYVLDMLGDRHFAGIGCREADGTWTVRYNVAAPPRASAQKKGLPAGGPGDVGSVVETMSAGDALGAEEEAALLAKRWRQ